MYAMREFPVPQTRRELQPSLGMRGYYRGFCRNFSNVIGPLTDLISPSKPFTWSPTCQVAFESAKALLGSAPSSLPRVSHAPLNSRLTPVRVAQVLSSSRKTSGSLITWFANSQKNVINIKKNYSTIEKEALALLLSLQHFEVYSGSSSHPITVYTDHNALVFLAQMKNSNQRLMRWSLLLQDFNITVVHKK